MAEIAGPPGPPGSSNVPARLLTSAQLEAVIQRAVELQTTREDMAAGLSEAEVLRIGQELGPAGVLGPGVPGAPRPLGRPAAELGMFIEQYLTQVEFMVVERRYPDRTRYRRGSGIGAAFGRAASKMGSRQAALDLQVVDVGVAVAGEDSSIVELSIDLQGQRAGFALGAAATGVGTGGTAALVIVASTA